MSLQLAEPLTLPRERRVPDHVGSWGPDARELAALAGVSCQPWQALVIDDMLAERPNGRWACRESGLAVPRQNGKSVVAEIRILAGLYVLGEELIVYTAHQLSTAKEIFLRLVGRVEDTPDLLSRKKKISYARGDEGIELHSPRQRLIVRARSKDSVRGFSADVLLFDEAQLGLDDDEMAALGPTQRTRPNPQTVYMGTPPLGPGTYWAALRRRALVSGRDGRMGWHEWSPPDGFDRTDRAVWRSTNPGLDTGLITEDDIEHDLVTLGHRFDAEGIGAWPVEPTDGYLVIGRAEWQAGYDPASAALDPVAMCFDANPRRTRSSIAAAGARADGLLHAEVIHREPGIAGLADRVVELDERWRPVQWVAEENGPAGPVVKEVARRGVTVAPLSRSDLARACGRLFDAVAGEQVDRRVLRWAGAAEHVLALNVAVKGAVKKDLGDGTWVWHRMSSEVDISPLVALTGAVHGYVTAPVPAQPFFGSWR